MPYLSRTTPRYRRHKASGQAVVTLAGVDHYLGPWNSHASRLEYDRLVGEWLTAGRPARPARGPEPAGPTVVEVLSRYWAYVTSHFRESQEPNNIRLALQSLEQLYGHTPAAAFGPLALKSLRQRMIDAGQSRTYINGNVDRIKRMFKWAASEQILPVTVYQALATVAGLQRGRSLARETDAVTPVSEAVVEATLPCLPPIVADMVRLQRLTGARPAEICILRPCDLERSGDVWVYRPHQHKNQHRGRDRVVFIGPRGQDVLLPYLLRAPDAYCFSPAESEARHRAELRARRQTPVSPSQAARARVRKPKVAPGDRYDVASYRRAIHRACDQAFGELTGPLRWDELLLLARTQQLTPSDAIRHGKRGRWTRAGSVEALFPGLPTQKATKVKSEAEGWYCKLGTQQWSPNQLRHSAGTELRKKFGIEAAQVVLGHSRADVTQVYAERDLEKAARIMGEVG